MNRHNFTHTGYLRRIKAAILRAVAKASKRTTAHGIANAEVYNRRDQLSLFIVARRGGTFAVFDCHDNDVSALVKTALREFHANLRATA